MSDLIRRSEAFEVMRRLADGGAITSVSLSLASRPDMTFGQFEAIGVFLSRLHDASKWWIADWLIEGEVRFGEKVYQAASALERSERTLLNWVWVARSVPRSRRREELSFSTHAAVAALDLEEQRELLDQAVAEKWSSREMRHAVTKRRELGDGERECGDLAEAMARDLRTALRACGLSDVDVAVEISGAGFEYAVRIP